MDYSEDDIEVKNVVENFNFIKKNADNSKEKCQARHNKFEQQLKSMNNEGWNDGPVILTPQ